MTLILKEGMKIKDLKLFEKKNGVKNTLKTGVELKLFDKQEFWKLFENWSFGN